MKERQKETGRLYVRNQQQGEKAAVLEIDSEGAEILPGCVQSSESNIKLQLKSKAQMLREASLICLRGKGVCGEVSDAVWSTRVLTK